MKYIHMGLNQLGCLLITVIHNRLHFIINLTGNFLTVWLGMCQILTQEYFLVLFLVADGSDGIRHTILHDHITGGTSCLLDIIGCTRCNIAEDNLLCNTSTQGYLDILQHLALGQEHLILLWKWHGITCRTHSCWNNRDRIYRSHIWK